MANDVDPFSLDAGAPKIEGGLRPSPKFADRISKRILFVGFLLLVVLVGIFLVSIDQMDNKTKINPEVKETPVSKSSSSTPVVSAAPVELRTEASGGADKSTPVSSSLPKSAADSADPCIEALLAGKGDASSVDCKTLAEKSGSKPKDGRSPGLPAGAMGDHGKVPALGIIPPDPAGKGEIPAQPVPLTPEQQAANAEKQARATRMAQARSAGLSAKSFGSDGGAPSDVGSSAMANLIAQAKAAAGGGGPVNSQFGGMQKGDSEQEAKLDFLKSAAKDDRGYHPHIPMSALAKNEIKTGSFIPMTLEQSINSDLPGQITARVTEDVYDSITGCRLLIPALAKVVGKYDSKIALGQGRMLVVWNSLIFPNGDELNMAAMQGYDTSGQSGLESDVDNHYWRMFGLTFGMSMLTAGVQLSVPQPNPGVGGSQQPPTPAQVLATALAQQYGALGAQILGKYMAVQPTLRNFAGERFVVMVPHTVVFPKVWRDRCGKK